MSAAAASGARRIGDLIEVPPVKTVVRLREGRESPEEIAGSFVFTSEVASHLNVISDALREGRGQGYFLQGDFGSGKSHFLAALYAWLRAGSAAEGLSSGHEGLRRSASSRRKVLPVAVSLVEFRSATPLEQILLESIEGALLEEGREAALTPLGAFLQQLRELLKDPDTAAAFAALAAETLAEEEAGSASGTPQEDTGTAAGAGPAEEADAAEGEDSGEGGAAPEGLERAPGRKEAPLQPPSAAGAAQWVTRHPRRAYAAGMRLLRQLGLPAPQTLLENRKESFQRVDRTLSRHGYEGMFLLIDELSEFFRSKPSARSLNEDARTLQFLGERTAERPLWIVAAVQESIEATGDVAQSILRKIKDRFPVKLALSTVHIRALVSRRLVVKKPGAEEEIYRIYQDYRRQFAGFSSSFEEFLGLYPVHPATIALLDGLGDLFSQHRGIVDFVHARIAGDSRRGIPAILDRPPRELLGPDSIYEHFSPRLAEFSAFNIYPRHIVPHLDGEIDRVFENGEDRHLARRLIRMLVLYRIHPTAGAPTAATLAELAACSLDLPEMNARFIAEAVLDPLAASSRFLRRRAGAAGEAGAGPDPAQAVYEISSEEDSAKVLEARLQRIREEIPPGDSRLLLEPFSRLPDSDSWPGPAAARDGVVRQVDWNLSQRRALVRLLHPEEGAGERLASEVEARECDFALLLTLQPLSASEPHVTVWQLVLPPGDALEALSEHLALRLLQEKLSPSNPADAPLIPIAAERQSRLQPAAAQAALEALYAGGFTDPTIRVEAAVRQLRRFDSLLEAAGKAALSGRYPRFAEVAPRRYAPSPRVYQQLLESFVVPGSLSFSEARPLSGAIEGLAVPLGLVELKRGSYVFSPDVAAHPLLVFFFELLRPAGSVSMKEVLRELTRGPFGLPRDTALFLLASLAAGGLISARRGGRATPLEYLSLQSLERAEEIALGELIGEHDRATLLQECGFLSTAGELESFGLRQQRDAWKEVVAFRASAERLAADASARLAQRREYSSFRGFRFAALEEKLEALRSLASEIRVSYSAKEGLEKFLAAWRASGLDSDTVRFLQGLDRFLRREAEKFVFVHHYLRHEASEKAAGLAPELEALRQRALELLENPEALVVPDEAAELDRLFTAFRERYVPLYAGWHGRYHENLGRPVLSRNAARALAVLQRLAAIEALDRPPGLDRFLVHLASAGSRQCGRQVREELMRAPVCGCGFLPGQSASREEEADPEARIDRYLEGYLGILKGPRVLEALGSHAYAVQDLKPQAAAHLRELAGGLQSGSLSASALVGSLDQATAVELATALGGKVSLRRVDLGELVRRLAGRRLPAERILALAAEWLGKGREGELIAVEAGSAAGTEAPGRPGDLEWWPLLGAGILPGLPAAAAATAAPGPAGSGRSGTIRELEESLEERFPAARLAESFRRAGTQALARYIRSEPLHTRAIQKAWQILAERALRGEAADGLEPPGAPPQEREAGLPRRTGGREEARPGEGRGSGRPAAGAGGLGSRHADLERAAEVDAHLELAGRLARIQASPFPERLSLRLGLEALLADPWTDRDLQAAASAALAGVAELGERWLGELGPVEPVDLEEGPLVLLVDGAAADLWLSVMDLIRAHGGGLAAGWTRLQARPETVAATAEILGLTEEPLQALEARGIPYLQRSGREAEPLSAWLQSVPADRAALVRLGALDRGAHQGALKLSDMAAILRHLLESQLPGLLRLCREQGRALVLTTDHGLSLGPGRLGHGAGGVYERAIFRATWRV